jgi:hypothetical protein
VSLEKETSKEIKRRKDERDEENAGIFLLY